MNKMLSVGFLLTAVLTAVLPCVPSEADLAIATDSLPSGMEMVPYTASLEATNGVAPYTWSAMPNPVAWGYNGLGQTDVPSGLGDVVAIAGGYSYSLALKSDGTMVEWGSQDLIVPKGLSDVVAIAGGGFHCLALKSDKTVVAWGGNGNGSTTVPLGLSNVVAIAAGGNLSLALKSDGTVVAWGRNYEGQAAVPPELSNVVAIAASSYNALVLKSDGTLVTWGEYTNVPPGLSNVVAIAGGEFHSLALKSDGTVVAWGNNWDGQTNVPPGLSNVVAIAGGSGHSLALQFDGTVVAWGRNNEGQCNVPPKLDDVVAIAAGELHNLALRAKVTGLPVGFACTSNGMLSGLPTLAGTSLVTFVAQDSVGAITNKSLEIVVAPNPNTRPVISSNAPSASEFSMNEATSQLFQIWASDPEGSNLSYSWLWDGVAVGGNAQSYTHTSAWGGIGLHHLRCYVLDDLWTNVVFFEWAVTVLDLPIEITTPALPTGMEMVPYSASLEATNGVAPYEWSRWPNLVAWGGNSSGQTDVPWGLTDASAVAGGHHHSLALTADGTVVAWGYGFYGATSVPAGLSNVVAIAAGDEYSLALKANGTVAAWGGLWNTSEVTNLPPGLTNVVAIAGGSYHGLALKADGTVVAWGDNSRGQTVVPAGLSDVMAITGGSTHSLALRRNGTVVGWGNNYYGQLDVPSDLSDVVAIAADASHSLAVKADGTVVEWGDSYNAAPSDLSNVVAVAAGISHFLALKTDGTVVAWGANDRGQCNVPAGLSNVVALAGGMYQSLAVRSKCASRKLPERLSFSENGLVSGTPILAGTYEVPFLVRDSVGAVANKSLELVIEPNSNTRPIISSTAPASGTFSMNECTSQLFRVWAGDPEGSPLTYIWTWDGIVVSGNGDSFTRTTTRDDIGKHTLRCYVSDGFWTNAIFSQWDVAVEDLPIEITTSSMPTGMEGVAYNAVLEATNGIPPYTWSLGVPLVAWGNNESGQTTVPQGLSDVVKIAGGAYHSLALRGNGTVVAWGRNNYGQTSVPSGLINIRMIAAGFSHSLALKSDGRVVAWGANNYGQTNVPAGLSSVTAIAAGGNHSLALKSDGRVVAWGMNNAGQTNVPSGLSNVVAIAGGAWHSLALRANGTVVAWGENLYNETNVPTGLSNVVAIAGNGSHCLALKSDGTVVAWGWNNFGQASVPPDLCNVSSIAAGWQHSLAIGSASAALPEGLACSSDGIVSGIPTLGRTSGVTFVVRDSVGGIDDKSLKIAIAPNPVTTNVIYILTDRASVSVPEGGEASFQVKLSAQPQADAEVTVARISGDSDIAVSGGVSLTFTPSNWETYQTVSLAVSEDDDNANGTAIFSCVGVGLNDAELTAAEIDDDFTLSATAINGAVIKDPDASLYENGTEATLTVVPNAGYNFTGWSGDVTETNNPLHITMSTNLSVTANFVLNVITVLTDRVFVSVPEGCTTNFQVRLSAQPTGDTVVVAACASGDADITPVAGTNLTFATNTWDVWQTVFLEAAEDNDDDLNGEATITCVGIGITNATVTVTEIDDDRSLTVTAVNGTVVKVPDTTLYDNGTEATLTAIENAGYHFTGWSGDATGTTNPITIVMNFDKNVTANFALNIITVMTDRANVSVLEGGSANFQVKLSAQPAGDAVVAVSRSAGDPDIAVTGGASLIFSTTNWDVFQSVTLFAEEDNDDNLNGSATITCSANDVSTAEVEVSEVDDDFTLAVTSLYGIVTRIPDTPYYDNGTMVILTATADPSYTFMAWTGDLTDSTNPASIIMNGNKSVTAKYAPNAPVVLPPAKIAKNNFVARWEWAEGVSPEGELSVTLTYDGYVFFVPGYEARYVVNSSECLVNNLVAGKVYSYRVRLVMPDGTFSPWSSPMKVRTGSGIPVFKHLLSDVPVAKGLSQEFAISSLVTGVGTLAVKSSNINAVKATLSAGVLKLQYLWNSGNTAKVTMTLTHPATGYKASYGASLSRAGGSVAVVRKSGLIKAGTRVAQNLTLENRTSGMVYGVRVRAKGLDNTAWLINRTGLDPVSKAAIREIPCVLPAGSQMVVRLVYNIAYKTQAKTRPVAYGAWAVMTPVNGAMPVTGEMDIGQPDMYDGLWLLGLPANRNRLYRVYHSDDDGANWTLNVPVIRATANYLMWLDTDEGAPAGRLYRVVDAGM